MKFGKTREALSPRQLWENRFRSSRGALLVVVSFTLINIGLAFLNGDVYFLFSAMVPYFLVLNGLYVCGNLSDDWYEGGKELYIFEDASALIAPTVFALLIVALFFVCYLMSKRHVGWLIASAALFAVDFAAMFFLFEVSADMLMDAVFHVFVLGYLIMGILAAYKLRDLPTDLPAEPSLPQDIVFEEE